MNTFGRNQGHAFHGLSPMNMVPWRDCRRRDPEMGCARQRLCEPPHTAPTRPIKPFGPGFAAIGPTWRPSRRLISSPIRKSLLSLHSGGHAQHTRTLARSFGSRFPTRRVRRTGPSLASERRANAALPRGPRYFEGRKAVCGVCIASVSLSPLLSRPLWRLCGRQRARAG